MEKNYTQVRMLTADNPAQQRRLDVLRPMLDEKMGELQTAIELRRSDFAAAQAVILSERGKRAMDDIRRVVGEMDDEERRLLEVRHRDAESSARTARNVIIWGSVLGTAFVALVALYMSLWYRRRYRQVGKERNFYRRSDQ
jgi:CHASE3 domain sensor protein